MPATRYTATDPNGIKHTRSTKSRAYTHTVVVSGGYQTHLKAAQSPDWAKTDARSFDWFASIAEGRNPHYPSKRWRTAPQWTAEQIAEEDAMLTKSDAAKVADAKAEIEGHTVQSYVAQKLAERIARIEAKKAAGGYDEWWNAGWCGRFDLAHKLACQKTTGDYLAVILDAQEA